MKPLPRRLLLLPLIAILLASCGIQHEPPTRDAIPAPTTAASANSQPIASANFVNAHAIIILRHADIDPAEKARQGNATPLLPRGNERAKEVITALKSAGISRIITSAALRTQATAAPLAAELKLTEEQPFAHSAEGANAAPKGATEAQTVYAYLAQTAKPDQVILLVHHHSVIPSIMAEFGFPHEPQYDDATEFDRVYVLLPDVATHSYQLLRLRYGGKWE